MFQGNIVGSSSVKKTYRFPIRQTIVRFSNLYNIYDSEWIIESIMKYIFIVKLFET